MKLIIKGIVTIAILVIFGGIIITNFEAAKLRTINHYIPDNLTHLTLWGGHQGKIDKKQIERDLFYYTIILTLTPQRAETFAMLGFCRFYRGEWDQAEALYERAVQLNPRFFWFHYNLALIYIEEGKYTEAASSLKKALNLPPEITLKYIESARIYQQILLSDRANIKNLKLSLTQGYKRAVRLLIVCYNKSKNIPESERKQFPSWPLQVL